MKSIKTIILLLSLFVGLSAQSITIDYQTGWNMVGLPLEVEDSNYLTIFPESTEGTLYSFDITYNPASMLVPGNGYWLMFQEAGTATIVGTPINELTINLNAGWNFISGIAETVSIYSVIDPDSIITPGTLYGFDITYNPDSMLVPGKGYWLRAYQDGEITIPDIEENGIIYIVGDSYNSEGIQTTCYWMDGVRVELPGGDWATDIVVSNGNVYVSGTSGANACYWINQTRYDLPGNGGEGEAIAVDGADVYVAGWYNNGSCYWKNGERINLTTNAESQAFAIGIRDNGSVYVGGYYLNNNHYYIPCFWKNGNDRHNLPIPNGGDGEVYDMAFMDGNMRYYAGYTLHPDDFAGYVPKACYWRHTTRTDLPLGGSSWDIYGATGWGITIDGEDVYVAGYTDWYEFWGQEETTGGSFPQYWKNSTIHDLEGGPLTNFGSGVAYDIRVADGNVVAVGAATRDSSYYDSYLSACYWLNGERHYLVKQSQVPEGLEDWYWSKAMGVFIE